MERVKVLVTIPELERKQEYLDQMSAVSPRLDVEQRTCMTSEETAAAIEDVEILYAYRPPSHLDKANRLRWVQLHFSGIDHTTWSPIFDPATGIIVTNVAGAHAVSIAEYCITTMSILARGFLDLFRDKMAKTWNWQDSPPVELCGQTLGIVGYGHIGRELARLAQAFRMHILALKRNPEQHRLLGYHWPGVGDPDGELPERFFGPEELHALLTQSDFVVNCLPHTPETRNLFGESEFEVMKSTAYFINVGRGETIDDYALAQAIREGHIAGAALDAFETDPDPLPEDHPFWELDNIFISPHISGTRHNKQYLQRTNELFYENLRRYLQGEALLNRVTRERGY
jgi:phosphoglycerate dehydrogenase-like enzyme